MIRFRRLAPLVVALTVTLGLPGLAAPLTYPVPVVDGFPTDGSPRVTAATWILYDESSGTVLDAHLPDQERPMASITKIMTALLAIERRPLDEVVTISQRAADTGEREIDLYAGEQVELGALVKAAMIHSANDAATAIAEHVGGSVEGFVTMMNTRARELNMTDTSFANPHGLDAPDHFSTARDMLDLTLEAMKYPAFRDIVRSRKVIFPDGPDGSTRAGTATNLMLGDYEGMSGVKTGFTSRALLTFVSTAEREGRRLYAVILGSDGRRAHFADAEELLDYGFENLGIYGTLSAGIQYVSREPRIEPGPLVVQSSLEALVHLSGQGLMSSPPSPNTAVPEAPQIPIQVVERRPTEAPDVQSAWSYWWSVLVGS